MAIKVLVVDDSALMRKMLSDILGSDPEINVIGTAMDGQDALKKITLLNPDLVTLDIQMPVMDGLAALKKIMETSPRPVVMISSQQAKDSKATIEALELGAVDFILKPSGQISLDMDTISQELITKVKVAAFAKLRKYEKKTVVHRSFTGATKKLIAIGCSTGGPQTLEHIIPVLPGNIPACILIVQHMPPFFTKSMAERLASISELKVKEAQENDEIKPGMVYIAPGDYHMEIKRVQSGMMFKDIIILNQREKELGVRPNANIMMRSVAPIYKHNAIGLVLTGMGNDGTEGARIIKEYGGTVLVQDEQSSIIYGMPKSVVQAGVYDEIVELSKMPVALLQVLEL
ncbi:chemotaxis response regulator protein-glutamate methylesterase [Candidatus Woesearchaeota archaeon]|nr:chemotaxis response regulator protein-glutamate methylesterase [Candidatus Woesearchaeota archaeon]